MAAMESLACHLKAMSAIVFDKRVHFDTVRDSHPLRRTTPRRAYTVDVSIPRWVILIAVASTSRENRSTTTTTTTTLGPR